MASVADPDLGSIFFLPGSRILNPDPHQRILVFFTQKTDTKFSKIRSGMFIPDPGSWLWIFFASRIPGTKKQRIRNGYGYGIKRHYSEQHHTVPASLLNVSNIRGMEENTVPVDHIYGLSRQVQKSGSNDSIPIGEDQSNQKLLPNSSEVGVDVGSLAHGSQLTHLKTINIIKHVK
jgi:hypothetical protein